MPLITDKTLSLQRFLHRDVVLDNLHETFSLLSEFRDAAAETPDERKQIGALAKFHRAVVEVTGQDAGRQDADTEKLLRDLNAEDVDPATAADVLDELKFGSRTGVPMEWPTLRTTGEVGPLSAVFRNRPWQEQRGRIGRFSVFADDARW